MKSLKLAAVLTAAMALPATADVAGSWRTATNEDGASLDVAIAPCGGAPEKVCGVITALNGAADTQGVVGRRIIWDMTPDGADAWSGGKIDPPDDEDVYASKMKLTGPDTLKVSGCILGGLVCRGQDWTRLK